MCLRDCQAFPWPNAAGHNKRRRLGSVAGVWRCRAVGHATDARRPPQGLCDGWFERWIAAERALEGEAGRLLFGNDRTLVVKFAILPKRRESEAGIKVKRVFVGQVGGVHIVRAWPPGRCADGSTRWPFQSSCRGSL